MMLRINHRSHSGFTLINEDHVVKVEFCTDENSARAYGSPIPATLRIGVYLSTGETIWGDDIIRQDLGV